MLIPKPDFTAWFVMQGYISALHHNKCKNDVSDQATLFLLKPLEIEASKTRNLSACISKLPYRWQYRIGDLCTNRGRMRHFYARKKEIERHVRQFLEREGVSQVVILGAGLDVLSGKLAGNYPHVKFIEVDTKQSQAFKTGAYKKHGIDIPANITFIEGDLRNSLGQIVGQTALFTPGAKTIWIAEGLLMFIPEASVTRIFNEIKALSAPESYAVFTTLPAEKQTSTMNYFLQKFFLRKEECPMCWTIPLSEVASFAEGSGLKIITQVNHTELQQPYTQKQLCQREGENLHIARIGFT